MAKKTKAAPAQAETDAEGADPAPAPEGVPTEPAPAPKVTRFDGIRFDQVSATKHTILKPYFLSLGDAVEAQLVDSHTRRRVLEHLEDAFRLVGAAIKDEQLARGGAA